MAADKYKTRHALITDLKKSGAFDAETIKGVEAMKATDARKWFEDNVDLKGWTGADIESLWTKKVTIEVSADAGEEVEVMSPQAAEPDDVEMDEEEPQPKSRKAKGMTPTGGRLAQAVASNKGPSIASPLVMAEKAYDRAIKDNRLYRGHRPVFDSGEQASRFGAWLRMQLSKGADYDAKALDRDILGKAHVTYDNSLGGALVPDEFVPNLIDVKNEFGAARRAIGVTNMSRETLIMPRIASDATVAWLGEGSSLTAQSTPTFDNVQLVAKKAGAYFTISNELMNDAAVNIADALSVSLGRAFGEFEDDAFFLGENDTVGINDLIPAASASTAIYDSASGGWSGYTVAKVMAWLGKIPDAAWRKGNVSIVCSVNFYHSVLLTLAQSAGGALASGLLNGIGGRFRQNALANADAQFDGIPVFFTNSAPTTYSADQAVAWAGAFDLGAKFGEVSGSNSIATSEHVAFASDSLGVRAIERIALVPHDIQDDANSMVITLKD